MGDQLANLTIGRSIIIGVILGAIYYSALYNNGATQEAAFTKIKAEHDKLVIEVKAVDAALKDAERFKQTMAVLGEEMEVIQKAIPSQLTSVELMKIVSTEAKGVGAEINKLNSDSKNTTSAVAKGAPRYYEPVSVIVELTGTYNQILLFLSNLTKIDKIITAKNMTLLLGKDKSAKNASNPEISMSATLLAYKYISEQPEESKAKTPNNRANKK